MERSLALPVAISTGIAWAAAVYHLLLYPWRRERREYFAFAWVCASAGLYGLFSALLYYAADPVAGAEFQRLQMLALVPFCLSIVWFLLDFLGIRPVPSEVRPLSLLLLAVGAAIVCSPSEWTVSRIPDVKRVPLPWSLGTVVYHEMRPGSLATVLSAGVGVTLLWAACVLARHGGSARPVRRRSAWCIVALMAAGALNDASIQLLGVRSLHMGEWAILGLLAIFAWSLSRELREAMETEVALARSEGQARALLRSMPIGVLLVECPEGEPVRVARANPAATRMLGLTERGIARPLRELGAAFDDGKIEAHCRDAVASGRGWTGAGTFHDAAERSTIYEVHITPAGHGGALLALVDATERHAASAVLRDSRERYRALVHGSPTPIVTVGQDEEIVFANEAAAHALGHARREDLVGLGLPDLADPEALPALRAYLAGRPEGGGDPRRPFELRVRGARGTWLDVELTAGAASHDPRATYLLAFQDVTERKRADERRRVMVEGLRAIVASAPELVRCATVDELLRLAVELSRERLGLVRASIYVHEEGNRFRGSFGTDEHGGTTDERATAFENSEWPGMSVSRAFEPRWGHREAPLLNLRGGRFEELGASWVAWAPITSDSGLLGVFFNDAGTTRAPLDPIVQELVSVYASFVGVLYERLRSEERRRDYEERWHRSQRLESIGVLAGGIAHDINNVLGIIVGFAERALRSEEAPEQVLRDLEGVISSARRGRDVVGAILAFSRRSEIGKSVVDLVRVLHESARIHRALLPAMVEIRVTCPPEAAPVLAAETQLHQVLMNLCTNAAQAMGQIGGVLELRLSATALDEGDARRRQLPRAGDYYRLEVIDTGPGMADEVAQRAFEPYFTTKRAGEGTGLGLATVHGIVGEHGGAIELTSELGVGTTVAVLLPRSEEPLSAETAMDATPRGQGETILVVDDEPDLLSLTAEMLEVLGYEAIAAGSAAEAEREFLLAPERFLALVTDQSMPGGTGLSLARRLRERRPDLRVLLVTGLGQSLGAEPELATVVDRVLTKPYGSAELAAALAGILRASATPEG